MDAGAVTGNLSRYITDAAPDDTPPENSSLQHGYNILADCGLEHFLTDCQNDPPTKLDAQQLRLTTYYVGATAAPDTNAELFPTTRSP